MESAVTLNYDTTDEFGNPVPDVSWNIGEYEKQTMKAIRDVQRRILDEMGATNIVESSLSGPPQAAHMM